MSVKDLIDIFSALLMPTIACMGIYYAKQNYKLAQRKRKDELFDRRYKFYKDVEAIWLSTGNGAVDGERPYFEWDEIESFAHEAEFLFDKEIADHLRSLAEQQFQGLPGVPDSTFSEPFYKYLKFED
jgi:hypothetical protein